MTLPRLFIDKLELTIPVEPERRVDVQERLSNASEHWQGRLRDLPPRGRYGYRYILTADNGQTITISSQQASASANYLKLDYSPERIGVEGAALLASYLHFVLGSQFRDSFHRGKVNRMDITFDVRRVYLHDLWFSDLRSPKKASAMIRGADLQAETLYLGYKSYRQLIVYDKNAELGRARNAIPWLRVEYRYGKGDYTLERLYAHLANPLHNFRVRRFSPLPPPRSLFQSRLLFDACRLRGVDSVLAMAPESEREELREAINSFPLWGKWTRVTSIWAQLNNRIGELLPTEISEL